MLDLQDDARIAAVRRVLGPDVNVISEIVTLKLYSDYGIVMDAQTSTSTSAAGPLQLDGVQVKLRSSKGMGQGNDRKRFMKRVEGSRCLWTMGHMATLKPSL